MTVLKQNTDYALRAMVHLAGSYADGVVSTKTLALEDEIAEPFAAKILQKLHKAGLITSTMGPKGGFKLSKPPEMINIKDVIEAMQGPVRVNRCSAGLDQCPRRRCCPVTGIVDRLDQQLNISMKKITLKDILREAK